ncbi:hypothetical protein [Microbulbifer celer]|uniref:Uncharacterized protein n=1 Tax=Microbulbifer celer TaxID=435905 RepID=A0ABW3UAI1_9GAMM|nr:hypothetical protein [Microbulbifer celer]
MKAPDSFDWLPEVKREIRKQEVKDAIVGAVVALVFVVCTLGIVG